MLASSTEASCGARLLTNWRLVLFLMIGLRFYFYAVQYFTAVYGQVGSKRSELQRRFEYGPDLRVAPPRVSFVSADSSLSLLGPILASISGAS